MSLSKIIASIPPDSYFLGSLARAFCLLGVRLLFVLLRHRTLNFYPFIFAPHFLLCCDIVQHYTTGWGGGAVGSREGEATCRGFSEAACRDFSETACRAFSGVARQCGDTVSSCPGHRCCHWGGRQRRESASSCHGCGLKRRCLLQKRQNGKAEIRPGQEQAQFSGAVGGREEGEGRQAE